MKRCFWIGCFFLASLMQVWALSPKREFRASWVVTVWRNDWPETVITGTGSVREANIAKQKQELVAIFDSLKAAGMNAVFFQVRSMSDAMYKSSYEPWSSFLTNTRGEDPGYDPLAYAVTEAHRRGLELHAWVNPYRYSTSSGTHGNLATDYSNTHPDWLMANPKNAYEKILNPGVPEVIQRITDIVAEIVHDYDVDGIVFDDYFYINGGTDDESDQTQYELYNPDSLSRADWRRQNVNKMVRSVYDTIQSIKPYVKFGIGPAGVAASDASVAAKYGVSPSPGSDWQYNGIYSDPLAWLSEGTIDYISPQIYWTIGSANDYAGLCTWWSGVVNKFGKHFYSSHSLSAMTAGGLPENLTVADERVAVSALSGIEQCALLDNQDKPQKRMETRFYGTEIGAQVACNRMDDLNGAPGSVFYATSKVVDTDGFIAYLRNHVFTENALTPVIGWKETTLPAPVTNLVDEGGGLSWQSDDVNVRYAIYMVPVDSIGKPGCFASSRYLSDVVYENVYELKTELPAGMTYAVSVVDRYGNESAPVVLGMAGGDAESADLLYPEDKAEVLMPCVFRWSAVDGAVGYIWQLSENPDFESLVCSRETVEPSFFSGLQANLKDGVTYYWRVCTRKANVPDAWSETFSCTSNMFGILYPLNGATNVETEPVIRWDSILQPATYLLEIASSADFKFSGLVYTQETDKAFAVVPSQKLLSGTTYYARVTVTTESYTAISSTTAFTTMTAEIPVPQIISPVDNSVVQGSSLEICWQKQNALAFRAELSSQNTFPPRNTQLKNTDAYTYCTVFDDLEAGVYYVRVKALGNDGYTDPSDYITVEMQSLTSLSQVDADSFQCTLYRQSDAYMLSVSLGAPQRATIALYALTGSCLWSGSFDLPAGKQQLVLPVECFGNGMYMLKVTLDDTRSRILKFVK